MQAVALAKLDMHKDAADMLSEAASLEEKKQRGGRGSWEATLYLFLDTIGFQLVAVIVVVTKHMGFLYNGNWECGFCLFFVP